MTTGAVAVSISMMADASNGLPTAAHVIYIPGMLMLGIVLGYIFGGRAARDAIAAEQQRKEARAARRAARREAEGATEPTAPASASAPASIDDPQDAAT